MSWRIVTVLLLGGALLAGSANAQSWREYMDRCAGNDPDVSIAACTALIQSGQETTQLIYIFFYRGFSYAAKGDHDRAIQDFSQSIKVDPLNPLSYNSFYKRGVEYWFKGDYDRAIQDFDQTIKLKPGYAFAFNMRGASYANKGDYEQAIWNYGEAIRLKPDFASAWNGRCWDRAIVGQLEQALSDCNESLRLAPSDATLNSRGLANLKLKRWNASIADYDAALKISPRVASSFYGRGLAKRMSGDGAGAKADIASARQIEPGISDTFKKYGVEQLASSDSSAQKETAEPRHKAVFPANSRFEFVQIRPGEFKMGCPPHANMCNSDDMPQHHVRISKGFEIGKYLVTQAMWKGVMGSNPSNFKGEDRPVEQVSWNDTQEFLQRLNAKNDGYRYRLPTEAEWEYAARAGTTAPTYGDLNAIAWYDDFNSGEETHPVGQKQPNAWGLYDMLGNVWEWVQDWYDKSYYQHSPGSDPLGPSSGQERTLRGGSWYNTAGSVHASGRMSFVPSDRRNTNGFRCVREAVK